MKINSITISKWIQMGDSSTCTDISVDIDVDDDAAGVVAPVNPVPLSEILIGEVRPVTLEGHIYPCESDATEALLMRIINKVIM